MEEKRKEKKVDESQREKGIGRQAERVGREVEGEEGIGKEIESK